MEKQTGKKVKVIQSNNGKEFVNATVDDFLRQRGILRRLSVSYCPEQNGIAKKRNRTLVEMVRCLLLQLPRPRVVRTGERERPQKLFHYRNEEAAILNEETAAHGFLSDIPMKEALTRSPRMFSSDGRRNKIDH